MIVHDLEQLILCQIERPAFVRVQELIQAGAMTPTDATGFRAAAEAYKSAMLARYDDYDPRVREALIAALLADYSREIEHLLADVSARCHREVNAVGCETAVRQDNPNTGGDASAIQGDIEPGRTGVRQDHDERRGRIRGAWSWFRRAAVRSDVAVEDPSRDST